MTDQHAEENNAIAVAALTIATRLTSTTVRRIRARKGSHNVYVDRNALAALFEAIDARYPDATGNLLKAMVADEKAAKARRAAQA